MRSVQLNLSQLGKVKMALHTLQGLLTFVAICIFIAMASQEGHSDGRGKYYCVVAVLTIPAIIYLAVVPLWERSQRFCNVFAFLAVDAIYMVLWLAAWASLVAWVRAGIEAGADAKKIAHGDANCSNFLEKEFGTEKKCNLGNDCVGVGVAVFVFFIPTTVISYLYLRKVLKEPGSEPWLGKDKGSYAQPDTEAGKDSAWSTDMHDDTGYNNTGAYDAHHNRPGSTGTERGGEQEDDEYQLLHGAAEHGTDTQYGRHPGRPWEDNQYGPPAGGHDEDTGYHGAGGYNAPSALSPDGYGPARDAYPGRGRQDEHAAYPPAYGYDR